MLRLLLLLLVGTAFAQSGEFKENSDHLSEDAYNEMESDEKDLDLSLKSDHIKPDFTEKAVGDVCPNKGTCVYHVFFTPTQFFAALSVCRKAGGNLSSIHNWHTNYFLQKFLSKGSRNSNFVWIGVWKSNRSSRYWNIDESPLDYTNWQSGRRIVSGQWCTAINIHTGKWWSINCNTQLPFLCSYED
ncbi:galactose-specific lectin nattectin-like [Hyla sarda]|uniref:galactose-specific lectin nattectin-like n=1 Tax=Hyla sarda TaxID=327740 RepID=UPI0024C2FBB7|nr:galactose-specific lectin nattectin-like [Hyla sarda]XP_056387724.1 galactose-specific lectin nattectin-like [Hyla sarda]XP_056387725.1 galactose-specific lectin nattectin-like [Hyla sarda]